MITSYSQQKHSVWAGLLAVLVLISGVASGAVPYYENLAGQTISGPLTTYNGITNTSGGTGTVMFDNSVWDLQMSDGTVLKLIGEGSSLKLAAGSASDKNVFCQLYVLPTPMSAEPAALDAGMATGLCVLDQAQSNLLAYTANGWTNLNLIKTVPRNEWLGFAVHLDYDNSQFDVYVTTNGVYTNRMKKANSAPLAMNPAHQGYFSTLTVTNSATGTGCVDVVAVSPSFTGCENDNTNLLVVNRVAGTTQFATRPPYSYTGVGANNLITGEQIGNDLSIGLASGDKIQVYDSGGWAEAALALGPPAWGPKSGTGTMDLQAGQGFQLVRGSGIDTLAFYPHGGTATPVPGTELEITMQAKNDGVFKGHTDLAIPASSTSCVDINALDFVTPSVGDELLFYPPVTTVATRYIYNGSNWVRVIAGGTAAVAPFSLCPGDAFIYYNYANSDVVLTVLQ